MALLVHMDMRKNDSMKIYVLQAMRMTASALPEVQLLLHTLKDSEVVLLICLSLLLKPEQL